MFSDLLFHIERCSQVILATPNEAQGALCGDHFRLCVEMAFPCGSSLTGRSPVVPATYSLINRLMTPSSVRIVYCPGASPSTATVDERRSR